MKKKNIYFFIGTTAEFIKIAPVIKELKKRGVQFKLITAGQTKVHFEDLEKFTGKITPDIIFKEKVNKASVVHFMLWAMRTLVSAPFVLKDEFRNIDRKGTYFIIHGDTVTSIIGAFVAKMHGLKLVHIESGDLSFNLLEPFPEEICRNINIRLADIMFSPTDWAKNNLRKIPGRKINTKQNTIIETCLWAVKNGQLPKFAKKLGKYYILIIHRQEHVIFRKNWSRNVMETVITNANPNLSCVILKHDLTVKIIDSLWQTLPKSIREKIFLTPRIKYTDFMKLVKRSEFIATDGASNQQEVYYMGKPCLALRDHTEQIEGLGQNVILSKSNQEVIKNFLTNYKKYKRQPVTIKVAEKPSKIIVDYLVSH